MLEPCAKKLCSDVKGEGVARWCGVLVCAGLLSIGCQGVAASVAEEKPNPAVAAETGSANSPAKGAAARAERAPEGPREEFNAGTVNLQAQKLKEAESLLETALGSQSERYQPSALYNLGHVRFKAGVEELKKGPAAKPTVARGRMASQGAGEAIQAADEALAGNDVRQMLDSYMQGRGVRKELKAALSQVKRALETYGAGLKKWQRAAGDFKSAMELNPNDEQARENAERMDRAIAKLIDSLKQLQEAAAAMGKQDKDLGEKMKQLKGRIPAPDMPPGAAGDDEEDEKQPFGNKPDQQEGPTKDGQEIPITPEQAGWLLDGFKLDGDKKLPMGEGAPSKPKNRGRATW
jgi:tetratricopeptide (TPR) repeat protein